MKKIFVCALIACLMLSCFSPAVAKAEESKRIDYTTVTDAINGKGIGDAGVGVIYRYYIDNELYFEKEVLYCVSYPDGYDYALGDVFVLQTYDENRGRIALYGSQSYSNMAVTVYSKTYDYLMELNGETTINTYTEKSCATDAASASILADDEIFLFNYEYVNSSNETIRVEVSDKYAWGFGAYSYYDDSNTLQTSTIRRTAPLGYRVSTDENGYKCFVRASLSFTSNLDAAGFESYVRELIAGEYSSFYIPYGAIVTDSNGCDYGSAFEFYFDCNEPIYLYYIDNKLYAYSDAAFTVVARGYFGDAMVYYYENCEAGSNMIYQYYVSYGETIETDRFTVEYSSKSLNNYVYPATNGGFTSNEVEQEDFSSAGTTFTAIYEPYTYEEFLDAYEAANSDTPIGSTPTPTPTPFVSNDNSSGYVKMTAQEIVDIGFAPIKLQSSRHLGVDLFINNYQKYDLEWVAPLMEVYGRPDCEIELKAVVFVGRLDGATDTYEYDIEVYDVGSYLERNMETTIDLLPYMREQSDFFDDDSCFATLFGGQDDEYIVFPYFLNDGEVEFAQFLGVYARYNIPEDNNIYNTKWRFFAHYAGEGTDQNYPWIYSSYYSSIGLDIYNSVDAIPDLDISNNKDIDKLIDIHLATCIGGNYEHDVSSGTAIDMNMFMTDSVENSISLVVAMLPQLVYFVGSLPEMFAKIFTFIPAPFMGCIVFSLCASIVVGIIKLFK